jgi:hypothetical protein
VTLRRPHKVQIRHKTFHKTFYNSLLKLRLFSPKVISIQSAIMPETIKVERRKYHSHIYWRVVFPLLLLTLLIGLMVFIAKYPAGIDAARNLVNRGRSGMTQQLNAIIGVPR